MIPPLPQPGDLLAGKYQLEAELGRGGMGAVFSARHVATGRRFAIKLLNPELAGDPEAEARFLREAMLASAINHPAIVEVYDVGREGPAPYMVMKLLDGETLGQRLKRGPLALDEAVSILLPVLQGIAAAHAHGILHRDLKPDNILLAREGGSLQPKVLDFGISKLLNADVRTRLTRTGVSIGTPLYMSPEQVRGESDVDARADVYALGVIAYEMLTGGLPFEGNNYADLILNIITGNAPGIREWNPNLPAALESVVARAMATERKQRHASVTELAGDLARWKNVRPSTVQPVLTQRPPPRPSSTPFTTMASERPQAPQPRARAYALGIATALALCGVLLWLLWPATPRRNAATNAAAAPAAAPPAKRADTTAAPRGAPRPEQPVAELIEEPAPAAAQIAPSAPIAPPATSAHAAQPAAATPELAGERNAQQPVSAPRPRTPRATSRPSEPEQRRPRASPNVTSEIIDPFE